MTLHGREPLKATRQIGESQFDNAGERVGQGDRYLRTEEAAALIGIRPKTLRNWRSQGKGPRPIRLGRVGGRVRYRLSDVGTFLSLGAANGVVPGLRRASGSRRPGAQEKWRGSTDGESSCE
ncbi:helix-turn-helix domain-containing protein [Kitasatospora sp. NPDC048538]|uniref:helix-turn-helix transcriptional regulator n=1 Tax=Kitasatospora sp. NPDC048538 TaxID=3155633 RepID=UPI0033DBFEA7